MSGSAKAGTIAERHACELRVLPEFAGARSSEARFRRIFFSLTKTYMDVGKPSLIRKVRLARHPIGVSNFCAASLVSTRRLLAGDPGEVRSRRLHRTCIA